MEETNMKQNRVDRILGALEEMGVSQMLIVDPMSIYYLTDVYNDPHERFYALLLREDGTHAFFLNNLFSIPQDVVDLPFGVYACKAQVEGITYLAVTNIGNRPTVGGHRITVEPWILDFDGDLYGKHLTLQFFRFLRSEQKFPDLNALKEEIGKNALQTRKFFENNTK